MNTTKQRPPNAGKGRPKGSANKATAEIRDLAQKLFDPAYWAAMKSAIQRNKVAPAVHVRLLAYAFGEPLKRVQVDGAVTVKDKRSVLQRLPEDVVRELMAQEAFEDTETDGAVN